MMGCKYLFGCRDVENQESGFRTCNCFHPGDFDLGERCETYFNREADETFDEVDQVYASSERLREIAERFAEQ